MRRCPFVFLNQALLPVEDAQISVEDAGFLLGDGIFETCGLFRGVPFLLDEHLERLRAGLRFVEIAEPASLVSLPQIIADLVQGNELQDCTARLRITVSRGSGAAPTLLVTTQVWESAPMLREATSVAVDFAERPVQASRWRQVKSTSRQSAVLAARHRRHDCYDSIQYNGAGLLTEGTYTNLFVVDAAGDLHTPQLEAGCLAGVTRGAVLRVAQQLGIVLRTGSLDPTDLFQAAEVFLTSSLSGVVAVHRVYFPDPLPQEWKSAVRSQEVLELAAPGPVTKRIQVAYQAGLEEATCRPS